MSHQQAKHSAQLMISILDNVTEEVSRLSVNIQYITRSFCAHLQVLHLVSDLGD